MRKIVNQDIPDYWNKMYTGEPYQDRVKTDHEIWYKFLDQALDHTKKLNILELGCGVGYYANYLSHKPVEHYILATDYSKKAIEICKARYPDLVNFQVMDARDISFSSTFDVIIAFELIEHFKDPTPVLYKIMKALKPGGVFLCSLPHKKGRFGIWHEHHTLWDYNMVIERFRQFWDKIYFHRVVANCDDLTIFIKATRTVKK